MDRTQPFHLFSPIDTPVTPYTRLPISTAIFTISAISAISVAISAISVTISATSIISVIFAIPKIFVITALSTC